MVIFGFWRYFENFRGWRGEYFAHFRYFCGILVSFWVSGVFLSFFGFWRYFGHFLGFGGILVIFRF